MSLKVYYLDDEPDLCENFAEFFSSANVEVSTFVDAPTALNAIRQMPPDLLFLDYRLIGTTGDEVAKGLDPKFPTFLVTGDISVKTDFKFSQVFSKPYKERDIAIVIQSFADKSAANSR